MATPNSSALRSFAAVPYDDEAAVLASTQITPAMAGLRVFTKDRRCFDVLQDDAALWDVVTAGGAKLAAVNTGVYDMDLMQDGVERVAMTVAERVAVAGAVRHDAAQTLSPTARTRAQLNIGITTSASVPSGGQDGDIWLQYEA